MLDSVKNERSGNEMIGKQLHGFVVAQGIGTEYEKQK
jgi:hypothetical protein